MASPKPKKPKVWNLEEGHVVYPAFVSEGEQYYYIKDAFNTFAHRALCALDVYEKFNMRCDREYLESFHAALDRILSNPSAINIQEIVELRMRLRERLDFALPPERIIWEFAAVAFFDESESPYKYDDLYGKEKIERWKKDFKNIDAFFLSTPIRDLILFLDTSKIDLQKLTLIDQLDKVQLHRLSLLGLSKARNSGTYSDAGSQRSSASTSQNAPLSNTSS